MEWNSCQWIKRLRGRIESILLILQSFIKIVSENPILWMGMKGASAESRKNNSDAETSLIFISPRFRSMT